MKELSIEEKAKRHDEVIEKLRDFYRDYDTVSHLIDVKEELANIFPELKESEGERIRKKVIEVLKLNIKGAESQMQASRGVDRCFEIYACNKVIAWLEKQGGKKPFTIDIDKMVEKYAMTRQGDFGMPVNCQVKAYRQGINDVLRLALNLEKQGEQKPADKVEPKFKVDDWITDGYVHCKITEILDDRYIIESKYNKRSAILFENKNRYHLWTINDAQDGDILSGEIDGEVFVFLFNQIQDRWIVAHVYYSETDGEFIEKAYLHRYHSFSPATKEQHNLLFQKMEEAGYDWDSEKKKLKKVESKTSLL